MIKKQKKVIDLIRICIMQLGLQTFFLQGPVSYCTKVQGSDILHNAIYRDMLHSTKSINILSIY